MFSYAIFSDIEDKNVLNLISEWDSHQYLDQHMMSERFNILLGTKSLMSEPLKIQILAGSDSERMKMVHDLRKAAGEQPCSPLSSYRFRVIQLM